MSTARALSLLVLASACGADAGDPYWAVDPIVLYPSEQGVFGVQSWELFAEPWGRRLARRWHVCGVVVTFDGLPTSPCEGCSASWAVETTFAESDCDASIASDPRFVALSAIGLAEALPDVESAPPHPEASVGAMARYADDWTPYGWAYPEALDHRETPESATWNGEEPFAMMPAYAWELRP